ncbi:Alcohol dehydrogenase zinc-binding domain protein [Alloalcanivorax dieselolei B5]|uniref:Alcohol dehydrogenase zinc-binding domain protein n=1 Tax=Alcanivorax dieselolei (strain DSM 16502 / CGMCC 1.3690 / MCCC 1A00001 / B-5) TaxID=930169 RepID=K0CHK5_ALCDB|nr:NAD(P)-dependent alcohol dehydrogenase [Alloalcanivorax dieselolei]AFT71192.1 Alcohol dehydrogenase zinc-binding domain protein [Alloalcanivorax dieselolei B5]GGJ93815.1 alcohol dehydrogenase [Alloalcanivorax dieselolei]
MNTYQLTAIGFDALTRTDRAPTPPGPGEVRIRPHAASINYRDFALIQGIYQADLPKPFVPLSDGAGTVEAIGAGVRRFTPGDRVVGHYTTGWLDGPFQSSYHATKLGGPHDGWLAETVTLPEDVLLPVPEYMTLVEAATLPVSGLTAWTALGEPDNLNGKWVLIQGTGSVSLMALQIAHALGANTVLMTSKRKHHATLRRLGATRIIDYRATTDLVAAVREATDGKGMDLAVEVLGGDQLLRTVAMMADNGVMAIVGFLRGCEIHGDLIGPLLARRLTLRAVSGAGSRTQFQRFLAFLTRHRIHPVVGDRYGFHQAADAIKERGQQPGFGKPVIIINPSVINPSKKAPDSM